MRTFRAYRGDRMRSLWLVGVGGRVGGFVGGARCPSCSPTIDRPSRSASLNDRQLQSTLAIQVDRPKPSTVAKLPT